MSWLQNFPFSLDKSLFDPAGSRFP